MKKKKKKNPFKKKEIAFERENMKEQGFFDGRFNSKVVPNKKKERKEKHKKRIKDYLVDH